MGMRLFTGRANPELARGVARELGLDPGSAVVEDFPDHEFQVDLKETIQGDDVYLVQPTSPPVEQHLFELLLLADACRRSGALCITGVIPYFGYARQDRRTDPGMPVSARLAADCLSLRLDRLILLDLHNAAIEGFFTQPVAHLSAVELLSDHLRPGLPADAILVAPDLGAVKLAHRYARFLDLPVAYIHKQRISGGRVSVRQVIGEVSGRAPVFVDDMISTGGTMVKAMEAVLEMGGKPDITVAATHGVLAGDAAQKIAALPVRRLVVTDSIRRQGEPPLPVETVSVRTMLARTIRSWQRG